MGRSQSLAYLLAIQAKVSDNTMQAFKASHPKVVLRVVNAPAEVVGEQP